MIRVLQSELVDELPANDPGAIRSRRDLLRINSIMGNSRMLARALQNVFGRRPPARLIEIGAGDGAILLRVARGLPTNWRNIDVTFVDLQNLLRSETKSQFAALGWNVHAVAADIFPWLAETTDEKADGVLANLVLHHFTDAQLTTLFAAAAKKADVFIAVEPRRGKWPLLCARLLVLIGCNAVTCHDGPISVRAGFTGRELSALWLRDGQWDLVERRAGLFSHLFIARRKG